MKKLLILSFFLPFIATATEFNPWNETDLLPVWKSTHLYQTFQRVATSKGNSCYPSDDYFRTESVNVNYEDYAIEAEICAAITNKQYLNLDHFKLTGRYRFADDIVDDPYTVVAGLSLIQAGKPALYDPASFHHGLFGVEAHLAVGKEVSKGQYWTKRQYGVLAFGVSRGYPWMRAEVTYSKNTSNQNQIDFFAKGLVGFGTKKLNLDRFYGYGYIQHRSIDLGVRYSYFLTHCGGTLVGEYAYRAYAKNFPKNSSCLSITFLFPIGIGI